MSGLFPVRAQKLGNQPHALLSLIATSQFLRIFVLPKRILDALTCTGILMPFTTHSRWIYLVALVVALAAVISAFHANLLTQKELLLPLLPLFGTFFGATFAFRLNEEKEARKLIDSRRESVNRTLFLLIRQANAMRQLRQECEKYPTPFQKAFNLPAIKPPTYADLVYSLADLDFLLDSSNPGLLMQLSIEQERFHQALDSLRIRNELYVEEVQPALANLRVNGKSITGEQAKEMLGERLFGGAMTGAQIAWDHISASDESIPALHKIMHDLAKETFPGRKFINYELTPDVHVEPK